ncbi:hypothetical protein Z517_06452 [Fonsecaea pedrosoi CBS 271.37]|uniref:Uncharacterized protein n=1 Tax=Fonsecaea pedrosoi CBS 271.37 TaxID=1442368 RepID=A0A0D2EZQ7_9EURO|nr:uncharacterized protein Z517_06452 [Fonsecaea pedrosoi CBS 271.37]KIW79837.1 hypothetical protein Z517_06452 [Fonsecaea pedrosoi CBS 271.37]
MADIRSTKRLRRSDERYERSDERYEPFKPVIYEDGRDYGPMVYFDQTQARCLRSESSFSCHIGDAVAMAQNWRQWQILDYLRPQAFDFIRSKKDSDNPRRLLEIYVTGLALCIGETIYERRPDGRLSPCNLMNVRVAGPNMAFEVSYWHGSQLSRMETVSLHRLESKSGVSLHLGRLPWEGLPDDWLLNWANVQYQRHIDDGAVTIARHIGTEDGTSSRVHRKG